MFNAADARKKTEENIREARTREMKLIEEKVNEAISNGQTEVDIEGYFSQNTTTALKEMGYTVETLSHYNEGGTTIKW